MSTISIRIHLLENERTWYFATRRFIRSPFEIRDQLRSLRRSNPAPGEEVGYLSNKTVKSQRVYLPSTTLTGLGVTVS